MNIEATAKKLRELRGYVPRRVVADALNISISALAAYESGSRIPKDELKVRISKYYNTPITDIFFIE